MVRLTLRRAFAATMLLVAWPSLAPAQQDKSKADADRVQQGEGIIIRVDPVDEGKDKDSDDKGGRKSQKRVRVTVNTSAVWRDYIRDQADLSKRTDAKKGEESVATKGQPAPPESLIVAEVGPDAKLIMRYRSSTDESNEGSRTIEGAEKKDGSPESSEVKKSRKDDKAPKIDVADLKPGLFVEVEAKKGKASRLVVIKPVGEGNTPASEADRKKK